MTDMSVELRMNDGTRLSVTAVGFVGPCAIHESWKKDGSWTVTDRSSGYRLWCTRTFSEAIKAANFLADNVPLGLGVRDWWRNLGSIQRFMVVYSLQNMAPRVTPLGMYGH